MLCSIPRASAGGNSGITKPVTPAHDFKIVKRLTLVRDSAGTAMLADSSSLAGNLVLCLLEQLPLVSGCTFAECVLHARRLWSNSTKASCKYYMECSLAHAQTGLGTVQQIACIHGAQAWLDSASSNGHARALIVAGSMGHGMQMNKVGDVDTKNCQALWSFGSSKRFKSSLSRNSFDLMHYTPGCIWNARPLAPPHTG